VDEGLVGAEARPGQRLDLRADTSGPCLGVGVEGRVDDGGVRLEGEALGVEVVVHEAEGAGGEEVRGGVEVAGGFGAEGEGGECEAVQGQVGEGGGEDGRLDGVEGAGRGWMVVGVVCGLGLAGEGREEGGGGA